VKQQEEGLLIVELVAGADANANASKEPESKELMYCHRMSKQSAI
jgi:hypothetical protein